MSYNSHNTGTEITSVSMRPQNHFRRNFELISEKPLEGYPWLEICLVNRIQDL